MFIGVTTMVANEGLEKAEPMGPTALLPSVWGMASYNSGLSHTDRSKVLTIGGISSGKHLEFVLKFEGNKAHN